MNLKEIIKNKKRLYQGTYLSFEQWEVILPDKSEAVREIVIPHDAVALVPVDHHRNIHLVRQTRIAVNELLVEIPAGVIENNESPEETARRELVEEIGLYPNTLIQLTSYYHAEGYSTGVMTLFLGMDLEAQPAKRHKPAGEFLEHVIIPFEEAVNWLNQGLFKDSKSILGILFAQKWL